MTQNLREHIKQVLSTVTKENAPKVFEAIQQEIGYKNIEDSIIRMMIKERMTASACLPHIEMQL